MDLNKILEDHKAWLEGLGGKRADLSNADLREADLYRADLSGANLRGAKLHKADLCDASLSGADLREAELYEADLFNANLHDANLCDANLRGAILSTVVLQVGPIGSRNDYVVYNVSNDNVQCGCWNEYKGGTLEEFEARIDEMYPSRDEKNLKYRDEYLAVVEYFKMARKKMSHDRRRN